VTGRNRVSKDQEKEKEGFGNQKKVEKSLPLGGRVLRCIHEILKQKKESPKGEGGDQKV